MHYVWKNCPISWQYQFNDKNKNNIILETIINLTLRLWHAFFGLFKENNDLNVFDCNPFVVNFLWDVGSHSWTMTMGMFRTIYLSMEYIHVTSFLCKPFMNPKGKKSHFVATLEFCIWGVPKFGFTLMQIHFSYGIE